MTSVYFVIFCVMEVAQLINTGNSEMRIVRGYTSNVDANNEGTYQVLSAVNRFPSGQPTISNYLAPFQEQYYYFDYQINPPGASPVSSLYHII